MALSVSRKVDELNALSREEAVELFLTLPAPTVEELQGELRGHTPDYLAKRFSDLAQEDGLGSWLGKGFVWEPYARWAGQGYNVWSTHAGEQRRIRFGLAVANSLLDGGPCIAIEYRAFDNLYADIDLADEVRRLDDGLYLGIATSDGPSAVCPWPGGPDGRSLPTTFLLQGPAAPAAGADDPSAELRGPGGRR